MYENKRRRNIAFITIAIVFVCLVILLGSLVVRFTIPEKSKIQCSYAFQSFPPRTNDLDSRPQSIVVIDFNHDQHLDLITLLSNTHTLAIYFGRSNGTFDNPIHYFIAPQAYPRSLAVARLNDDDHLDIVVANYAIHSISVFFGFGDGRVMDPISFSTSKPRPRQVTVADMTGDDLMDIVMLGEGTNEVVVFANVGNGSFVFWKSYWTGWDSLPYLMSVADLNGDGRMDLVVSNDGTDELIIFFGAGHVSGTFDQKIISLGMGADACHLVIHDLDGDLVQDLIVTKSGTRQIVVFYGLGNGTFQSETIIVTTRQKPFGVGVSDFTQDGLKDLLVIFSNYNQIVIFLGQGDRKFVNDASYVSESALMPSSFVLDDVNDDGRIDVIVSSNDTNSLGIVLGLNQVKFHSGSYLRIPGNSIVKFIFAMDFDGDSYSDMMVWSNGTTLVLFLNDGTGHFDDPDFHVLQNTSSNIYLAADMNNDGRMDMIVCTINCTQINVYFQTDNGTFSLPVVSSIDHHNSLETTLHLLDINDDEIPDLLLSVAWTLSMTVFIGFENGTFHSSGIHFDTPMINLYDIGDVNQDGRLDIVIATFAEGLYLLFGTGNGTFMNVKNVTFSSASYFAKLILKDMNNDKYLDYVVFNDAMAAFIIGLGDGQGAIDTEYVHYIEPISCAKKFFIDDFNGDLNMDVSIICSNDGSLHIYLGRGDGTFYSTTTHILNISISSWAFADFNHDNRLDWISCFNQYIIMKLGYDPGALSNPIIYSTESAAHPSMILANDFNHDQHLDLVRVNQGSDSITIQFGRGDGTFRDEISYALSHHSSPQAVTIGDFNHDQIPDLAVVNTGTDSITIFTGSPNGSFEFLSNHAAMKGSNPSSIIAADFNNDDWVDLAVANTGSSHVSLFFGYQYGRLIKQNLYRTGAFLGAMSPVLADFNNDQHIDLAMIDHYGSSIGLFLGDGLGNFVDQFVFPIYNGFFASVLLAGYIDNNTQIDLVFRAYPSSYAILFLNWNQSSWSKMITFQFDSNDIWSLLYVEDVNNDQYADLITYIYGEFRVFINLGDQNFSTPISFSAASECDSADVLPGYFNNDNFLDLIAIDPDHQTICIYYGNGDGTFTLPSIWAQEFNGYLKDIWRTDVNNDELTDLIITYSLSPLINILVTPNDRTSPMKVSTYSNPFGNSTDQIKTDDFNQDGFIDLVIVSGVDDYLMTIAYGREDGTFSHETVYSLGNNYDGYTIAVADLNHDNTSDIIVSINLANTIIPYLVFCCDPFSNISILPNQLNTTATFIAQADFNRDNRTDLIVAYARTNKIGLFLSHGNDTFNDGHVFSVRSQSYPIFIATGDFNRDDRLDLVVISHNEELIDIFFGHSTNLTFHFNQSYSIGNGSRPRSLSIIDFNNDHYLDIIVSDDGTDSVGILLGNGDGSFRTDWHLYTGYATDPSSIAAGDFNGDGESDVLVMMSASNTIGMIKKQCGN